MMVLPRRDLAVAGDHHLAALAHGQDGGAVPGFWMKPHPSSKQPSRRPAPSPQLTGLSLRYHSLGPIRSGPELDNHSKNTKETAITATVDLDGTGAYDIATGMGFLDHMIEQLARHSLIDITLKAKGDLHIDLHHTTEDTGIVLGQAVAKALGDKQGITRYGLCYLPMDEV